MSQGGDNLQEEKDKKSNDKFPEGFKGYNLDTLNAIKTFTPAINNFTGLISDTMQDLRPVIDLANKSFNFPAIEAFGNLGEEIYKGVTRFSGVFSSIADLTERIKPAISMTSDRLALTSAIIEKFRDFDTTTAGQFTSFLTNNPIRVDVSPLGTITDTVSKMTVTEGVSITLSAPKTSLLNAGLGYLDQPTLFRSQLPTISPIIIDENLPTTNLPANRDDNAALFEMQLAIESKVEAKIEEGFKSLGAKLTKTVTALVPQKLGNKFPYPIPAGTLWQHLTIKFLDKENIKIFLGEMKYTAHCCELGFRGRGKETNIAWEFLLVLSRNNGEINRKNPEARDSFRKAKEQLIKKLRAYFAGISDDPFYNYQSASADKQPNSYKIRIQLIPPSEPKQLNELPQKKLLSISDSHYAESREDDELGINELIENEMNRQ